MSRIYKKLTTSKETYITTLARLFEYSTTAYAPRPLSQFVDGTQTYTYESFRHQCLELSHRMSRFCISAGDKVAILSQNMPNWTVTMFSAVAFGRVAVPILPDSSETEITNIINHSGTKVLFVSKRLLPKVSREIIDKLTLVIDIETFENIKRKEEAFTCEGWLKEPQPDDLACIIYTSGTSGNAKGVMLSHRNLCQNMVAAWHAQKCKSSDKWLSVLPMSHTYEMAFSLLYPLFVCGCVYYIKKAPTPTILMDALKKVRPSIMCSVPLIIEKIYKTSVVPTIKRSRVLSWMKKHTPNLLYRLIGSKLKATFGGKLKFFGIGGSKLDNTVEEFLIKSKFPYAVGYGLTETAPLVTQATVGKTAVGSIGTPAYNVQVKLDNVNPETGEGEIIVKGDNVMLGSYRDPGRTRSVLSDDGWFRTNDLAVMDAKGRFYIKGRLNNMILGASGENIYPEEIEQVINNFSGVNESLVMERNGQLVALIKFDDNVLDWDQAQEDKFFDNLMAKKKAVLDYVNKHVGKQSKVNQVEVMKEPFEKTATHKIRRFKYKDVKGDDVKEAEKQQKKQDKEDKN